MTAKTTRDSQRQIYCLFGQDGHIRTGGNYKMLDVRLDGIHRFRRPF